MGQIAHALIEHRLTPEEILNIPEYLQNSSDDILTGDWHWAIPNMNKQTVTNFWTREAKFFINNAWSEEDLFLLEKGNMTLHFFTPHLVTFDCSISWNDYQRNEGLRKEFNLLTKSMLLLLKAIDVFIVPDLSSIDFFNENEDLTVEAYRRKANGDNLYGVELE